MRLYPAAFKPVLVDITFVGVVVPLDAVQRGSRADLPPFQDSSAYQKDDEAASSRAVDTPQKHDRWSSPE
jgi:hypothetical protein